MTDLDRWLAEVKAQGDAATPGPWVVLWPDGNCGMWMVSRQPLRWSIGREPYQIPPGKFYVLSVGNAERDQADAEFSACARTALPRALRIIARLREAVDRMLAAFDPAHPGACQQECFDTSDGEGPGRQDGAIEDARSALAYDGRE